jgi:hypothetical protein
MVHRCGALNSRGVKCKQVVDNAGDRCRYHLAVVSEENEHEHHSDGEVSHSRGQAVSASRSQVSQDATSEVLSGLLEKITHLEAELKRTTARNSGATKPPVAKATAQTGKKKRVMTPAGATVSARWIFYNEHKTDADILASVRGGLIKGNLLVKKTQVVDGVTIEKEHIPYTLVKVATDMKFDQLSQEDKESYLLEAYDRNEAKYA